MPGRPATRKVFITKARSRHEDKYDYSKVVYVGSREKIVVVCPEHGAFKQEPASHLRGQGCPVCAKEVRRKKALVTQSEFIRRAKTAHGDKYNYRHAVYVGMDSKLIIVCPAHGEFRQVASSHLRGIGCPACGVLTTAEKNTVTLEDFIRKARKTHGDSYNYSKTDYIHSETKVTITCPHHGNFEQTPKNHIVGQGCPRCGWETPKHHPATKTTTIFIDEARQIHGIQYDYSLVRYKRALGKVTIVCLRHGAFIQRASRHLEGYRCPHCFSSRGEEAISRYLEKHGVVFIREWKDHTCILVKRPAKFDFYLPNHRMLIEFDGHHHYEPVRFGGCTKKKAQLNLKKTQRNDQKKTKWAKKNGYKLIRIKYTEDIEEALRTRGPYRFWFHEEEDDEKIPAFTAHT